MPHHKIKIRLESGIEVEAVAPVIVSASRSTDIPAYYCDWFFHRLDVGYSAWINPFNHQKSFVSYRDTQVVVFWSKNPKPLLKNLHKLSEKNIHCYIQYTINDYEKEGFEPNVPALENRIDTFKRFVDVLGKGKVIWRFDPLIISDKISITNLLEKADNIARRLKGYNEKMVFSFADIAIYKKVKSNLEKSGIHYREWANEDKINFAKGISELNKSWNYELATCCEDIPFESYGIAHNKCIDDDLMIRFFSHDKKLMDFLGIEFSPSNLFDAEPQIIKTKNNKDKGQRRFCGCILSKDIGQYNTCPHGCVYCYANTSQEKALANYRKYLQNTYDENITNA